MSTKEILVVVCDECETTEEVECSHDIDFLVKYDGWEQREPDDEHEALFDGLYHCCANCVKEAAREPLPNCYLQQSEGDEEGASP